MVEIRKRLVDRIEALERQLAEAKNAAVFQENCWLQERDLKIAAYDMVKAAEAERDRLADDNARLREALEPFAKIAEIEDSIGTKDGEGVKITVDLFRCAAATLAGKE